MTLAIKIKTVTAFLILICAWMTRGQECNYIKDYYQWVYQAEVDYLEENYQAAYQKLKKAESHCRLLNQPGINEMRMMAVLSEKFGQKDKAFEYLHTLLKQGYPFKDLSNDKAIENLKSYPEWRDLEERSIQYAEQFNKNLDKGYIQEVEQLVKEYEYLKSGRLAPETTAVVDSVNEVLLGKLLRRKGYPTVSNIGYERIDLRNFDVLFTRVKDTGYFKQVLLGFVKRGKGSPSAIALMIDLKQEQSNSGKYNFVYGIADNLDSTSIRDFKNVDRRRIMIGLSPWGLRRKLLRLRGQGEFLENED